MNHSVAIMVGILDPYHPSPKIARPVSVPHWFAAILLLIVGTADLLGRAGREASYQWGWLVRDIVEGVDRLALLVGVWLRMPAPVTCWGVG